MVGVIDDCEEGEEEEGPVPGLACGAEEEDVEEHDALEISASVSMIAKHMFANLPLNRSL